METRVYSDLVLSGKMVMATDFTEFPLTPGIGTFAVKDQVLYCYLKMGGLETWYPFTARTNSHIHTQGLPYLTWTIAHGLESTDVWVQVKDSQGHITQPLITVIDANTVEISFTTPTTGNAVVVAPDTVDVPKVKTVSVSVANDAVVIDSGGVTIAGNAVLTTANSVAEVIGYTPENVVNRGAVNGYASLDGSGKVPTSQLPSFVSEAVEYANYAALPATGSTSIIYVTADNRKTYRWSGTGYIEVGGSSGTADTAASLSTPRLISLSGEVVGSVLFDGSQNVDIAATLQDSGVTAGTYTQLVVNSAGIVIGGSNPTTLAGYGITDAVSTSSVGAVNGVAPLDGTGKVGAAYLPSLGASVTIADNTATNSTFYPTLSSTSSGTMTTATVSSTKLSFNPGTGVLTCVDYNSLSDERLKTNVATLGGGLSSLDAVRPVTFNWKDSGEFAYGFIAQEIEESLPTIVKTASDGTKSVSYIQLIPIMLAAIKEMQGQLLAISKGTI